MDKKTSCGLLSWRPFCLQPLASKKTYMFFYGLLGLVQGMFYTYLSSTLSTLEKNFGLKSKESAFLMSGNEISQILFLLVMPFMIHIKKRPLWTSFGMICSGIGCLLLMLPHFIRPATLLIEEHDFTSLKESKVLCDLNRKVSCDASLDRDWLGLFIIFFGIVLTGVGNSVFYSFGIAYLDDNTSHGNSPVMLGLTYTVRLVGPTLGFFLGSYCLKTYIYPSLTSTIDFDEKDPRWMGAWWLGYPIIGSLILLFSLPLSLFPEKLPKIGTDAHRSSAESETSKLTENNKIKDFKSACLRLFYNKLYMTNMMSSVFYVFAFMGFGTFMPKYIQFQFRQSGSKSSSFVGGIGTLSKAVGLLISGFIIGRYKPHARYITAWNVILGVFYFVCLLVFSQVGCPSSTIYPSSDSCNNNCNCITSSIHPVCSSDGVTNFLSACHAGCTESGSNGTFSSCSCARTFSEDPIPLLLLEINDEKNRKNDGDVTTGWCNVDCSNVFTIFSSVFFVLMVLGSTGRIGNGLVALRSVEVEDKSISMAINIVFLSLFAMLPSPMVFGALIDSTCSVWQSECGVTTSCLLYDTKELRTLVMLTTAFIMLGGVLFDILVWHYSGNLILFNEKNDKFPENEIIEKDDKK